jgi:PKD repeat protein
MKLSTAIAILTFLSFAYSSSAQYYRTTVLGNSPKNLNKERVNVKLDTDPSWTTIFGTTTTPQWSTIQTLPFTFVFNGSPVNSYKVSSTGVLTFSTAATSVPGSTPSALPSASIPNNSICLWGLQPTDNWSFISYKTFGNPGNRQYWVTFSFCATGAIKLSTWSMVLEEGSNNIYLVDQWNGAGGASALSVGIQINSSLAFSDPLSPSVTVTSGYDFTMADDLYHRFSPGVRPQTDIEFIDFKMPYYVTPGNKTIEGTVHNVGTNPVTTLTVTWNDGSGLVSENLNVNIAPNSTYSFTCTNQWNAQASPQTLLTLTVTTTADSNPSNNGYEKPVTVLDFVPQKYVVVEERTGTWCGWCPRGAVGMGHLEQEPQFIGVAVHSGDPMEVQNYDFLIGTYMEGGGFPGAMFDRDNESNFNGGIGTLLTEFNTRRAYAAPCEVKNLSFNFNSSTNEITVLGETEWFGNIHGDYRLSCVIVEDDVIGTTAGWFQANAYAGGSNGTQQFPSNVNNGFNFATAQNPANPTGFGGYDHVARYLSRGDLLGDPNSLPTGEVPMGTYSYTFDPIPASVVKNMDKAQVIVMIVNKYTGDILNAKKISLKPTPPSANFTATGKVGCAPLTVQFNNASSFNTTTFLWQFAGGTPASSTLANPSVQYTTPGVYSVSLIASNSAGSSTVTQQNFVTVLAPPAAGFIPNINGSTVSLSNTSTNATSYSWNFGDGNTNATNSPSHVYATDGVYTITLTASNNCGTTTSTQTVTILTPPTANFTATGNIACAPMAVQFNNTSSSNATAFNWQFAGGSPATSISANPSVVYSTPGTYAVTLTVSNGAGSATETRTGFVIVNSTPGAAFSTSVVGANVEFTNTTTQASSYSWAFGDGTTNTGANPTHTYIADGIYTITLTAANNCGTAVSTATVVIQTPPNAGFSVTSNTGCAPLTATFTNTSSSNATDFLWQFPGGEPSSSTQPNPTVVYATPGIYNAVLTASNGVGSTTATQTNIVVVNGTPTPDFIFQTGGLSAIFTNQSTNATTYLWSFGDNSTSTEASPVHTYATTGTYIVNLVTINACGINEVVDTVSIVGSAPVASFTIGGAGTVQGCSPLTVQFQDASVGNPTAWSWVFEGGTPSTSTDQNPMVTYAVAGSYQVILTATNVFGFNAVSQEGVVKILADPQALFTYNTLGGKVNFTNTSVGATTYSWDFGDGTTSTDTNPTHNYTADGIYTTTLTAANNCGTVVSTAATVVIQTPPNAGFTVTGNTGCAPLTATFTNTSSSNATDFLWQFPGGEPSSSTQPNPTIVYATPGTYNAVLTASNGAGSTTATQTNIVVINGTPTPDFIFQTGGLSAIFTNQSTNATTYLWSFGDNSTSTDVSPAHTYASTGTYTVTLVSINECGTNEVVKTVSIVGTAPVASFTIGGAGTVQGCAPLTVQFQDASVGSPTAWSWSFEGGTPPTSTAQNPMVTYAVAGSYQVILTATNVFGSNAVSQEGAVEVLEDPQALFTYDTLDGTVNFANNSVGTTTYYWDFGDGSPASTEVNPSHTYAQNGSYTVVLTATNACGVAKYTQEIIYITTGTGEADWVQSFRLYPNPNTGLFYIELNGLPQDEVELVLCNTLGQIIRMETVDFGSGQLRKELRYEDLASGYYMLAIRSDANILQARVIVTK